MFKAAGPGRGREPRHVPYQQFPAGIGDLLKTVNNQLHVHHDGCRGRLIAAGSWGRGARP